MSLRSRLIVPVLFSALAVLAGCGGSSNPTVTPPPSGGFANSNLSGTYVFSATGTFADSVGDFVTMMGTFTADGKGNITGGVIDWDSTGGSQPPDMAITSGTYKVGSDGRPTGSPSNPTGLITLQTSAGPYSFDYVLTSSEHGLLTEFDANGSASGTLDLQTTVAQSDIDGQSFAFNLTGSFGLSTVVCVLSAGASVPVPAATVGNITLDGSGNISAGLQDINDNCSSNGLTDIAITAGSVDLASSPGKASITTGTGGSAVTYNFDIFPIDKTHLKLIETDASPILVGDAFTQTSTSFPSGTNVFTFAGFDNNVNVGGPFTAAGILNADGNGNITQTSAEDINDFGLAAIEVTGVINGTYTAQGVGRWQVAFTSGFINGNNGTACAPPTINCTFAVYPSSGGLQFLEIDNAGVTNGVAYPQVSTSALAAGEGYGMNLSGAFLQNTISGLSVNAEDDIAEFTNNSGTLGPGIIDINDQGSPQFKITFQANYAADSAVPGRGTVTPSSNGYLLTTYIVDDTTTVAVSTDPSLVALGALVKQNATAKSNAAATHLSVLRAVKSAAQRSRSMLKRQIK